MAVRVLGFEETIFYGGPLKRRESVVVGQIAGLNLACSQYANPNSRRVIGPPQRTTKSGSPISHLARITIPINPARLFLRAANPVQYL